MSVLRDPFTALASAAGTFRIAHAEQTLYKKPCQRPLSDSLLAADEQRMRECSISEGPDYGLYRAPSVLKIIQFQNDPPAVDFIAIGIRSISNAPPLGIIQQKQQIFTT